jgi:DNA helicase-2/ATP-dependent DNA helicase PcrA
MKDAFLEAYEKLNDAQKEAVDAIDGPVMVIAGPGTGKTQILTLRIGNILRKTDTPADGILALTFTENAASNMRKRLLALIGTRAYQVNISTFHSWCDSIINEFPEYFENITQASHINDIEKIGIIESITDSMKLKALYNPNYKELYTKEIASAISKIKREGVNPEEFSFMVGIAEKKIDIYEIRVKEGVRGSKADLIKYQKKVSKNIELSKIYTAYREYCVKNRKYDFDDMIIETLNSMKKYPELKQILQERHMYVLVDEHQDTNNAQNKIIELLMDYHDSPNLFIVGDEKQSIFKFQGASVENFLYFQNKYKNTRLVVLDENYRSSQNILDAAENVLSGKKSLVASGVHSKHKEKINILKFETDFEEAFWVAQKIKYYLDLGVSANEIVVIYRNKKHSNLISAGLRKNGVPFQVENDEDIFTDNNIASFLSLLSAIYYFGDDEYLLKALHLPVFDIAPTDIHKILKLTDDRKKIGLIDVLTDKNLLETAGVIQIEKVEKFVEFLTKSKKLETEVGLEDLCERVFRDSGFLTYILEKEDSISRLNAIKIFFDFVSEIGNSKDKKLKDLFDTFEVIKKHELFISRKLGKRGEGMVKLMTAHKAKGLEFEVVFVLGLASSNWEKKRSMSILSIIDEVYFMQEGSDEVETSGGEDEERRLFYVAVTRAKKDIFVSYSEKGDGSKNNVPSLFLEEISSDLKKEIDPTNDLATYRDISERIKIETTIANDLHDKDFIRQLFDNSKLSPTALNNYLKCPWRYFYVNLLTIPAVQSYAQKYGNAVHYALEQYARRKKTEGADLEFFMTSFKSYVLDLPLTQKETEEMLEQGEEVMPVLFKEFKDDIREDCIVEYKAEAYLEDVGISIGGKIDRIDFVSESKVKVVDYKTGKQRTRNEILGATKNSDGGYFRQLVFYKLLISLNKDKNWEVVSGELNFVEPNDKDEFRREVFDIEDEKVEELKTTIVTMAEEVRNLSFWDKRCDDSECEYCKLREMQK